MHARVVHFDAVKVKRRMEEMHRVLVMTMTIIMTMAMSCAPGKRRAREKKENATHMDIGQSLSSRRCKEKTMEAEVMVGRSVELAME